MRAWVAWLKRTEGIVTITALWTAMMVALVLGEFFHRAVLPRFLPPTYGLLLLLYAIRNAYVLWLKFIRKRRRGEVVVWGWWVLFAVLFIVQGVTRNRYQVTEKMVETLILVTFVFLGSTASRVLYLWREARRARRTNAKHRHHA